MRTRMLFLAVAVAVCSFTSSVTAQTSMSDEKKKLISEMVSITKMDSLMQQLTDEILKGMEITFQAGFNQAVDANPSLSPQEKDQLKATESESFRRFSAKFRDRIRAEVDYKKYIEESVYPIYDKFYTEQELKDLVQFYSTPTGQKVITTMPQLFAESQKAAQEKLLPQVMPIITELVDEELKNIAPAGTKKEVKPVVKPQGLD